MSRLKQPAIVQGALLGLAGIALAYLLRALFAGRLLMDPLPLALTPAALMSSLREGFTYFDLRSPVLHLVYAVSLGIGAAWLTVRSKGNVEEARASARVAAGLGVLVVAIQEVDAFTVVIYYAIAAFVSLSISAYAADRAARRLHRRQATSLNSIK